jgi:hypothetical protein
MMQFSMWGPILITGTNEALAGLVIKIFGANPEHNIC